MLPPEGIERLRGNLARIRGGIASACDRAGRNPADVQLVAVTKYSSLDAVQALLSEGQRDLGENRIQQLAERAALLGAADAGLLSPMLENVSLPRWHMIGHLQRNKVKSLLKHASIVHSLDSSRLGEELEKQAAKLDRQIDAFLEVNVAGEESKSGAAFTEADAIAEAVMKCAHIRLRGLMTMAPYNPDPETVRPYFARLREKRDEMRLKGAVGPECVHLSMGMTVDYAVAVEEGATFVRIGSALFEGVE